MQQTATFGALAANYYLVSVSSTLFHGVEGKHDFGGNPEGVTMARWQRVLRLPVWCFNYINFLWLSFCYCKGSCICVLISLCDVGYQLPRP